jgi:hypothetical protein
MRNIILILCIISTGCCGQKKAATPAAVPAEENLKIQNPLLESIPVCISQLIEKYKSEEKQNPPRKVYSYLYQDKMVYYVPAICCDFFSDLYDDECKLLGHPDGGFTGRGDGTVADFIKLRSNEKLLWEDKR